MRPSWDNLAPEEWKERQRNGRCPVCGKLPSEFRKGMMVYCTPEHREEYYGYIKNWGVLRQKVLDERGEKCVKCGITNSIYKEQKKKEEWTKIRDVIEANRDVLEAIRANALIELSKTYEEQYKKLQEDEYIAGRWEFEKAMEEKGTPIKTQHIFGMSFEVDHINAFANGGNLWDEKNLQVLCSDCHKEKTKHDLKLIKGRKLVGEGRSQIAPIPPAPKSD